MKKCEVCILYLNSVVDIFVNLEISFQFNRSLMFTEPGLNINVTARPFLSSGCQLRVLAIGGGGEGNSGGGESGYIQFHSETFTADTFISLTVGDPSQSSSFTVNGQAVTAAPGYDYVSNSYQGADGYSGGGGSGSPGCDGGTDGHDGEDCAYGGGRGSGDDVTTYKMDNFVLTPGAGGKYFYDSIDGYNYGGGGGGVMVNGQGPQRDSDNQGEGYGGGGGRHYSRGTYDGLPGVILMEVEEH